MKLSSSIDTIEQNAFYNCYGFTGDLEIPEKTYLIDKKAFYNCSGFENMILKSEIVLMNDQAFGKTNFSVVTYSGKKEPLCGLTVFPENQAIHFTAEYDHREFCGIKVKEPEPGPDDEGPSSKKNLIIIISLSCVFAVIIVVLIIVIVYMVNRNKKLMMDQTKKPRFLRTNAAPISKEPLVKSNPTIQNLT